MIKKKLTFEGHILPCLHFDGLCKPTLKHPYTIVRFGEKVCSKFHISDFIGRMPKLFCKNLNCYWLKRCDLFNTTKKTLKKLLRAYRQLYFFIPTHH